MRTKRIPCSIAALLLIGAISVGCSFKTQEVKKIPKTDNLNSIWDAAKSELEGISSNQDFEEARCRAELIRAAAQLALTRGEQLICVEESRKWNLEKPVYKVYSQQASTRSIEALISTGEAHDLSSAKRAVGLQRFWQPTDKFACLAALAKQSSTSHRKSKGLENANDFALEELKRGVNAMLIRDAVNLNFEIGGIDQAKKFVDVGSRLNEVTARELHLTLAACYAAVDSPKSIEILHAQTATNMAVYHVFEKCLDRNDLDDAARCLGLMDDGPMVGVALSELSLLCAKLGKNHLVMDCVRHSLRHLASLPDGSAKSRPLATCFEACLRSGGDLKKLLLPITLAVGEKKGNDLRLWLSRIKYLSEVSEKRVVNDEIVKLISKVNQISAESQDGDVQNELCDVSRQLLRVFATNFGDEMSIDFVSSFESPKLRFFAQLGRLDGVHAHVNSKKPGD